MGIQGGQHAPRSTHGGHRIRNLLLGREAPYPLGHTSAELMQNKAPFGGRERSEETWEAFPEDQTWDYETHALPTALHKLIPTLTREGLGSKSMAPMCRSVFHGPMCHNEHHCGAEEETLAEPGFDPGTFGL